MKISKTVTIIIFILYGLNSCKHKENIVEPEENEINSIVEQKNSQILVYAENISVYGEYGIWTGGIGSKYEVTEFDKDGLPVFAKIDAGYGEGFPGSWGEYPSTVKLKYDNRLRLTNSVQVFKDLVIPSSYSVPDGKSLDPDREIYQEYEYDGYSNRITHELRYYLNTKTKNKQIVYEVFRTFNTKGRLLKSWNPKETIFESTYDKYGNPLTQKRGSLVQNWEYKYDASGRVVSRKVSGTKFHEENIYDNQGRLIKQTGNISRPGFQEFITPSRIGQLVSDDFDHGDDYFHVKESGQFDPGYFAPDPYSFDFEYIDGKTIATNSLRDRKYIINNRGKLERQELLWDWDGGSGNAYFFEEYIYDASGTFVKFKQWVTDKTRQNVLITYGIPQVLKYKQF